MGTALGALGCVVLTMLVPWTAHAVPSDGSTSLVSTTSIGEPAGDVSSYGVVSGDGRFVAFGSNADALDQDAPDGARDIFVRDLTTGELEQLSRPSDGWSARAAISHDGRWVAFRSTTGGGRRLVLRDRTTGDAWIVTNERYRLGAPSLSADGTTIVWWDRGYHVWDRATGAGSFVCTCAGWLSFEADLSADGSLLAVSTTEQLVPGDTDAEHDIYVIEIATGEATLASGGVLEPGLLAAGMFTPALSADGRHVAFLAFPAVQIHPVPLYSYDLLTEELVLITRGAEPYDDPAISADGRYVAYTSPGALLGAPAETVGGVHRWDRTTGRTMLVSLTDDDRPLAYAEPNIVCVFVAGECVPRPTTTGTTAGVWGGFNPTISADGDAIVFDTRGPFDSSDTNRSQDVYLRLVG